MDKTIASEADSGDEENYNWEATSAQQRAWSNCMAFTATILLIIGEFLSDQNFIGVVVIGGPLTALNVFITTSSLEKAAEKMGFEDEDSALIEDNEVEENAPSHQQVLDRMSIDVDELLTKDESSSSYDEYDPYEYNRSHSRHLLSGPPRTSHRRRYDPYPEQEAFEARHPSKSKKRARKIRREYEGSEEEIEADVMEDRYPNRSRDFEGRHRKNRQPKERRERYDGLERRDKHRDRSKRERRSRDKKQKKKKRVTIASGSAEQVIIGEV